MLGYKIDICYDPKDYVYGGQYYDYEDDFYKSSKPYNEFDNLFWNIGEFRNGRPTGMRRRMEAEDMRDLLSRQLVVLDCEQEVIRDDYFVNYGIDYLLDRTDGLAARVIAAAVNSRWGLEKPEGEVEYVDDGLMGAILMQANDDVIAMQVLRSGCVRYHHKDGSTKTLEVGPEWKKMMMSILYTEKAKIVYDKCAAGDYDDDDLDFGFSLNDYLLACAQIDLSDYLDLIPEDLNKETWSEEQTKMLRTYEKLGDTVIEQHVLTTYIPHFENINDFQQLSNDAVSNKNLAAMLVVSGLSGFFKTTSNKKVVYNDFADMFECLIGMLYEASGCSLEAISRYLFACKFDVYCFSSNSSKNHPLLNLFEVVDLSSYRLYWYKKKLVFKNDKISTSLKIELPPLYSGLVSPYTGRLRDAEFLSLERRADRSIEKDMGYLKEELDSIDKYSRESRKGAFSMQLDRRKRTKLSVVPLKEKSGSIMEMQRKAREFDQLSDDAKVTRNYKFIESRHEGERKSNESMNVSREENRFVEVCQPVVENSERNDAGFRGITKDCSRLPDVGSSAISVLEEAMKSRNCMVGVQYEFAQDAEYSITSPVWMSSCKLSGMDQGIWKTWTFTAVRCKSKKVAKNFSASMALEFARRNRLII